MDPPKGPSAARSLPAPPEGTRGKPEGHTWESRHAGCCPAVQPSRRRGLSHRPAAGDGAWRASATEGCLRDPYRPPDDVIWFGVTDPVSCPRGALAKSVFECGVPRGSGMPLVGWEGTRSAHARCVPFGAFGRRHGVAQAADALCGSCASCVRDQGVPSVRHDCRYRPVRIRMPCRRHSEDGII